MKLEPTIHMQVEISNLYMNIYNLTPDEFLKIDEKYSILEYIQEAYEPFHLMGNDGIIDEIQSYIDMQKACVQ